MVINVVSCVVIVQTFTCGFVIRCCDLCGPKICLILLTEDRHDEIERCSCSNQTCALYCIHHHLAFSSRCNSELITHKITYLQITFQYFQQHDKYFILAEIFSNVRFKTCYAYLFCSQNEMG